MSTSLLLRIRFAHLEILGFPRVSHGWYLLILGYVCAVLNYAEEVELRNFLIEQQ